MVPVRIKAHDAPPSVDRANVPADPVRNPCEELMKAILNHVPVKSLSTAIQLCPPSVEVRRTPSDPAIQSLVLIPVTE